MRTKEEIRQAIEVLSYKDDKLSRAMAEVLQNGKTERQVFEHYVMNMPESAREIRARLSSAVRTLTS